MVHLSHEYDWYWSVYITARSQPESCYPLTNKCELCFLLNILKQVTKEISLLFNRCRMTAQNYWTAHENKVILFLIFCIYFPFASCCSKYFSINVNLFSVVFVLSTKCIMNLRFLNQRSHLILSSSCSKAIP